MQTKVYRGATLRLALEKARQALGAEALVLSHREVRRGGIFGFGARNEVEVTVLPNAQPDKKNNRPKPESLPAIGGALSARDDSFATPFAESSATTDTVAYAPRLHPNGASEASTPDAAPSGTVKPRRRPSVKRAKSAAVSKQGSNGTISSFPQLQPTASSASFENAAPFSKSAFEPVVAAPPGPFHAPELFREFSTIRSELREVRASLASRPAYAADLSYGEWMAEPTLERLPAYGPAHHEAYRELLHVGLTAAVAHEALALVMRQPPPGQAGGDSAALAASGLTAYLNEKATFSHDWLLGETGANSRVTLFVGPTGVGKTTTIAKLAAVLSFDAGKRVELATLDTYRVAAVTQLQTYADIMEMPCHILRSARELEALAASLDEDVYLLVDTAGHSPNNLGDYVALAEAVRSRPDIARCIVLPATTQSRDAAAIVEKFSIFGLQHLILTKIDETLRPGAAVGAVLGCGLPLSFIGTGQKVPQDIHYASAEALAQSILRHAAFYSVA
jgi:flagellar biosynthesis protein FlhF